MKTAVMLHYPPPTSNAERQAEFRKRNPGYFKKYRQRYDARTMAAYAAAAEAERLLANPPEPEPAALWHASA